MFDPYNVYVKEEFTQFIDVSKVHTIFEIGARECGYTQEIIDYYTSCNELHSFECNPYTVGACIERINNLRKTNAIKKVAFNNLGISSQKEVLRFYPVAVGDDYGSSSVGFFPTEKSHSLVNQHIEVDCNTIDFYCKEHSIKQIDLLLIDIEGGELEAFKGASTMLSNISYIISETQDVQRNQNAPLRSEIRDFLGLYGFEEKYTTCAGYFGDSIFIKK